MSNPIEQKLYTPKPVQSRVIERHLTGASNREIAREEGLDRETVSRILSQREFVTMLAEHQSRLLRLAEKALTVYEKTLDSEDAHLAAATATKILEGSGVLNERGLQQTIDDSIRRKQDHDTYPLPEFEQGADEYVRRRTRRKPVKTELQVVPAHLIDERSRTVDVPGDESTRAEIIPDNENAR